MASESGILCDTYRYLADFEMFNTDESLTKDTISEFNLPVDSNVWLVRTKQRASTDLSQLE
ncbi:hypothetical protein [Priestia megaterium]|uniref:hypothetical protein n=1 Tax=Priestia megaterium TaxID=1404 RepID=UPI0039FCAF9A